MPQLFKFLMAGCFVFGQACYERVNAIDSLPGWRLCIATHDPVQKRLAKAGFSRSFPTSKPELKRHCDDFQTNQKDDVFQLLNPALEVLDIRQLNGASLNHTLPEFVSLTQLKDPFLKRFHPFQLLDSKSVASELSDMSDVSLDSGLGIDEWDTIDLDSRARSRSSSMCSSKTMALDEWMNLDMVESDLENSVLKPPASILEDDWFFLWGELVDELDLVSKEEIMPSRFLTSSFLKINPRRSRSQGLFPSACGSKHLDHANLGHPPPPFFKRSPRRIRWFRSARPFRIIYPSIDDFPPQKSRLHDNQPGVQKSFQSPPSSIPTRLCFFQHVKSMGLSKRLTPFHLVEKLGSSYQKSKPVECGGEKITPTKGEDVMDYPTGLGEFELIASNNSQALPLQLRQGGSLILRGLRFLQVVCLGAELGTVFLILGMFCLVNGMLKPLRF